MFKTQVEPRAAGEWFHCQVYGVILLSIRVKTIENCRRFDFYNNKDKLRAELVLFSVEKARALHLTSFLLSVLF